MEKTKEEKGIRLQKEGLMSRAYQNSALGRILVVISLLIGSAIFLICYFKLGINVFISIILGIVINQIFIFIADRIIAKLLVKKINL